MRPLVSLLILFAAYGANGATFQSVGTTNDLVLLPAPSLSVSSNFVVSSTAESTTLEAWQWQTGDSHTPDGITYLASVVQPTAGNFVKMSFGGNGGTTINPTDGYIPDRLNSTTFEDSSILMISGTPWSLTKGVSSSFYLSNTNFDYSVHLTVLSGAASLTTTEGTLQFGESTDNVILSGNVIYPSVSNSIALGASSHTWKQLNLATNGVIYFGTNTFSTDGANHPTWNGTIINVP